MRGYSFLVPALNRVVLAAKCDELGIVNRVVCLDTPSFHIVLKRKSTDVAELFLMADECINPIVYENDCVA